MSISKDGVLAALDGIASPDGLPLPSTGKLSDIVVADGKVFFSITVDASAVQAWEAIRERAQKAVSALPGVQSVMVALTAERTGGAGPGGRAAPPHPQVPPAARPRPGTPSGGPAAPSPARIPGAGGREWRAASQSPPAKAGSASRPRPSISRWRCASLD